MLLYIYVTVCIHKLVLDIYIYVHYPPCCAAVYRSAPCIIEAVSDPGPFRRSCCGLSPSY